MNAQSIVIWYGTFLYFLYVVLGPVSPKLHKHVYTGCPAVGVVGRLKRGQLATISEEVYSKFFFPAFFKHYTTYRVHVWGAALWLLTGMFNLQNPPIGRSNGFRTLHRLVGWIYVVAGLMKGVTVPPIAMHSPSLGIARKPCALIGVWDVISLLRAVWLVVVRRDIAAHQQWMSRNFAVGLGSIWVRGFSAVWAACELATNGGDVGKLSMLRSPAAFKRMNNIVILGGFAFSITRGEWLLSPQGSRIRRFWGSSAIAACMITATFALQANAKTKREISQALSHSSITQTNGISNGACGKVSGVSVENANRNYGMPARSLHSQPVVELHCSCQEVEKCLKCNIEL